MANKTKKRLVTGIACAVPAVIAIPSLLALTQCGSASGTEHVELSGDTKKEESKTILQETFTYEFILKNVDEPTTVQVSLPTMSINNKVLTEGQKLQIYTASVSANSVVTIKFDRNEIIKAAEATNDETTPYVVKFDVNLKNDQINETLSGFSLNLVMPKFDVKQTLTHTSLTSIYEEVEFGKDYTATIEADKYYQLSSWDVKCNGESIKTDNPEELGAHFEPATGVLKIDGYAITGDIEIIFTSTAIEYDIDYVEHIKHEGTTMFDFVGLPGKVTVETEIFATLNWIQPAWKIKSTEITYYDEDLKKDVQITNYTFNNDYLWIPAGEVKGKLTIKVTDWSYEEYDVIGYGNEYVEWVIPSGTKAHFKEPLTVEFKMLNKGHKVHDTQVMCGESIVDPSKYSVVPNGEWKSGFYQYKVTVKGEAVTGNMYFQNFTTTAITHKVTQTSDSEGHAVFKLSEQKINWGDKIEADLAQVKEGQETIVERGYSATINYVQRSYDQKNWVDIPNTPKYITNAKPSYNQNEALTGIEIAADQTQLQNDAFFRISIGSQLCKRDVNIVTGDHWSASKSADKADVASDYTITFTIEKGWEFDKTQLVVAERSLFDETATYSHTLVENEDYTINEKGTTLTLLKGHVLDNIQIRYGVKHVQYNVTLVTPEIGGHFTWTQCGTIDKEHAYVDQYYASYFEYDPTFYVMTDSPDITMTDRDTGESKLLQKGTDYTWAEESKGKYRLSIEAGVVKGDLAINVQCQEVSFSIVCLQKQVHHTTTDDTYTAKVTQKLTASQPGIVEMTALTGYEFNSEHIPYVEINNTRVDIPASAWKPAEGEHPKTATLTIDQSLITPYIQSPEDVIYVCHGCDISLYDINVPKPGTETHFASVVVTSAWDKASVEDNIKVEFEAAAGYTIPADAEPTVDMGGTPFTSSDYTWNVYNGGQSGNYAILNITKEVLKAKGLNAAVNISLSTTPSSIAHSFTCNTDKATATEKTVPTIEQNYVVDVEAKPYYYLKETPTLQITYADTQAESRPATTGTSGEWQITESVTEGGKTYATKATLNVSCATSQTHGAVTGIYIDYTAGAVAIPRTIYCKDTGGATCEFTEKTENPSYDVDGYVTITAKTGYTLEDAGTPIVTLGSYEGQQITPESWDPSTGKLKIGCKTITSDIYVKFKALPRTDLEGHISECIGATVDKESTFTYTFGEPLALTYTAATHSGLNKTNRPQYSTNGVDFIDTEEGWWLENQDKTYTLTIPAEKTKTVTGIWVKFHATPTSYNIGLNGDTHCSFNKSTDTGTVEDATRTWTLTLDDTEGVGYELYDTANPDDAIQFIMGGVKYTSTDNVWSWTKTSDTQGTLKINANTITGTISVSAKTKKSTNNVVFNCTNCSGPTEAQTVLTDAEYTCTITSDTGYDFGAASAKYVPTVTGVRNGWQPVYGESWIVNEDKTNHCWVGTLKIPANTITGGGTKTVSITCAAQLHEYDVTAGTLTHCSKKQFHDKGDYKNEKVWSFTADPGYQFTSAKLPTVTGITGWSVSTSNWNPTTGELTIPAGVINNDIKISVEATAITRSDWNLTDGASNCQISTTEQNISIEKSWTCTIKANDGYELSQATAPTVTGCGTWQPSASKTAEWSVSDDKKTGTLTIPAGKYLAAEVLKVSYSATASSYSVDASGLTKCTLPNPTKGSYVSGWTGTLVANAYCDLPASVTVTSKSGATYAAGYDSTTGVITIAAGVIKEDFKITAAGTGKNFGAATLNIDQEITCTPTTLNCVYDTDFELTLQLASGKTIENYNVTLTIGGSAKTFTDYWTEYTGIFSIPGAQVTGVVALTITPKA